MELDSQSTKSPSTSVGHAPVGIHREIVGLAVLAERHAGIDALIGEIELAQAPQHFLNIDRIGAAPDLEQTLMVARHDLSAPDD